MNVKLHFGKVDEGLTFDEKNFAYNKTVPAGTAEWRRHTDGCGKMAFLQFTCPCGCGAVGGLPVGGNGWQWDGNETEPTMASPSILMCSPCAWHGCLKKGVFERC
jgi:hypothetical protein